MKKATFLFLSIFTLSLSFGQPVVPNLMEKAHELSFQLNKKSIQTLKTNNSGQFKLDSIIRGYFDPITDSLIYPFQKLLCTYDQNGYPASVETYASFPPEVSIAPYERIEFSYDEDGNLLLLLAQYWNPDSLKWRNTFKITSVYDEKGNLEARRAFTWEVQFEGWAFVEGIEYTYTESNQMATSVYSTTLDTGKIIQVERVEYTYDENGYPDSTIFYIRDTMDMQWIPDIKYCQDFDQFGNQLLYAEANWDPEKQRWIDHYRDEKTLTYNEENQVTSITNSYKSYSDTLLNFASLTKVVYEYDEWGKLILETGYNYNGQKEEWVHKFKWEYTYGTAATPELAIRSIIARSGIETWVPDSLIELKYDLNLNLVDLIYAYWKPETEIWQPYKRYVFPKNEDILIKDLNFGSQMWIEDFNFLPEIARTPVINNNPIHSYEMLFWNDDTEIWEPFFAYFRMRFFYSSVTPTAATEVPSVDFKVYPNPAKDLINIETDPTNYPFELTLFDLNGKNIYQEKVSDQRAIRLPSLPSGLYILQLTKSNRILGSKKLMIGASSN